MWTTIATFKENLSQIASDVQDTADELEIGGGSERRPPEGPAERKPLLANGIDSNVKAELEWYKGEIQRLQNAEAEIQAMSINYASILKEREEELSTLHDENGKLKKAMEGSTTGYMLANGDDRKPLEVSDISKVGDNSLNGPEVLQGQMDMPATRQQRYTNAPRNQRVHGKHGNTGTVVTSNGSTPALELEGRQQLMELKIKKLQEREKELTNLLQDETQALVALKGDHDKSLAEIKKLKELREIDQADFANVKLQLQKEQDLNEVVQNECTVLKAEKQQMSMEIAELQKNLNDRNAERNKLQEEHSKRKLTHSNEYVEKLKNTVATLEKEKIELQTEKDGLINHLKSQQKQVLQREYGDGSALMSDMKLRDDKQLQRFPENLRVAEETYRLQILELEQSLKNVSNERDKAVRNLARLKQHLLEKEHEDSEKMDHDSAHITELQAQLDARNDRILQLEKFLAHAIANQEEIKKSNIDELQKANEVISDLRQKLAGCVSVLESKNVELQNLQTVLGQYYAESEAKDRVFGELASAREEIIKLSEGLKAANHGIELKNREKEEILDKLALAERRLSESQQRAGKFEEEILRLRRALEQSMTRLNRMSLDSDYLVDRRIVIKLLVTYFQRQHSKEVLDLMVRMLGFTEEDKQRIGLAQHVASKGVVRGVLGLPGRLVGGILGSGSSEVSPPVPSENQSFSDLWIDFLLKESQERERRENAEEQAKAGISRQDRELTSADSRGVTASETHTSTIRGDASLKYPIGAQETVHSTDRFSNFPVTYSFMEQNPRTHTSREGRWANPVDTEFSTVPLTSGSNNQHSRVMPKP